MFRQKEDNTVSDSLFPVSFQTVFYAQSEIFCFLYWQKCLDLQQNNLEKRLDVNEKNKNRNVFPPKILSRPCWELYAFVFIEENNLQTKGAEKQMERLQNKRLIIDRRNGTETT